MLNFSPFTEYNIKNFEVCFSGLIAVTACYVYSFNNTNMALQLLNLAYSLNEKKCFALRTGLTIIWLAMFSKERPPKLQCDY